MDYYENIFKRKSFHLFRNAGTISDTELEEIKEFIKTVKPLDDTIPTRIEIVPQYKTSCRRGAQYCIEFYSENKGNYLRNIGYIGEQIDLFLASVNIGALWFGIARPNEMRYEDMEFVIMIAVAKMPEENFRKDMFKAKRKPIEEIWSGDELGIANIVRFTPSACNTQPWYVNCTYGLLDVYRYKKAGKRGIMPADKVTYYNRIDMGIFEFILECCLKHEGYLYESAQIEEHGSDEQELTQIARYRVWKV